MVQKKAAKLHINMSKIGNLQEEVGWTGWVAEVDWPDEAISAEQKRKKMWSLLEVAMPLEVCTETSLEMLLEIERWKG